MNHVQTKLNPLKLDDCPFAEKPDLPNPTTWVEPKIVVEVKFHSWTEDDHLRAPVFLRLRDDLKARDVKARDVRRPRVSETAPTGPPAAKDASGATGEIARILAQL